MSHTIESSISGVNLLCCGILKRINQNYLCFKLITFRNFSPNCFLIYDIKVQCLQNSLYGIVYINEAKCECHCFDNSKAEVVFQSNSVYSMSNNLDKAENVYFAISHKNAIQIF